MKHIWWNLYYWPKGRILEGTAFYDLQGNVIEFSVDGSTYCRIFFGFYWRVS